MCAAKKTALLIDGADLLRRSQLWQQLSRRDVLKHAVQFDRTIHCTEPVDNRPELEAFKLFAVTAD